MRTHPYKHKLNMLEPGLVLCRIIGLLFLAGCALCALGAAAARIVWTLAALCLLTLCLLVCIEHHQDRVLNELALREDAARNRHAKPPR